MGNESSSMVINENRTLILNDTNIKVLNKNITNQIANTIINNAKTCSSSINQLNNVVWENVTAPGDFNLNVNQSQQAALTFSCLDTNKTRSDVANNMLQEMMTKLQNDNSSSILAEMDAMAKASQKNGFLSTSFGNTTNTDSRNIVDYRQKNTLYQNLQNIIENSITNNFTTNNISNCIAAVNNNQTVSVKNMTISGEINAVINQNQGASAMTDCIQESDVGSKITNNIINTIGIKSESSNKVVQETKMKAAAESSQVNAGFDPMASLSSCFGLVGGPIIGCIICVVLCCVIVLAIKVIPGLFGDKEDDSEDQELDQFGNPINPNQQFDGRVIVEDADPYAHPRINGTRKTHCASIQGIARRIFRVRRLRQCAQ